MPTSNDVAVLIHHIADHQIPEAQHVVQIMIAHERSKNRGHVANQLEFALQKWQNQSLTFIKLPNQLKSMAWDVIPDVSLDSLVLDVEAKEAIDHFLLEWQHVDALMAADLNPDNRLLISGPPGNGKTSVAYAIAKHLSLPFIAVKTSQVVDSHLGETGKNINAFFQHANEHPCILFFDELDAITSMRGLSHASADKEYNGIVTTFLVQLDRLSPQSIIVAATNLASHIDEAILRRFSHIVTLSPPTSDDIRAYLTRYEVRHAVSLFPNLDALVRDVLVKKSWADVERFCQQAHKAQILDQHVVGEVHSVGHGSQKSEVI